MLLLYATVACVLFGGASSDVTVKEKCYGGDLTLSGFYTPPFFNGQMYFTPSNGGSRQLVMNKGEPKHPRLKVQIGSVQITDLTEKDDGTFSISKNNDEYENVLKLTIKDCVSKVIRYYGKIYSWNVPRKAEFLEFTPLRNVGQSTVLWNRTNPQTNNGGRGRMRRNEWEIKNLIQADMGHYNLRAKDNTLLSRILLEVREHTLNYTTKVNERLLIPNPPGAAQWTVAFTPEVEKETQKVMRAGKLLTEDEWYSGPFAWRMLAVHDGLVIDPVESKDSGTFEFRDPQGNLAQTVHVLVQQDSVATFVYVGIVVGIIFAVIACCCCVRKCCCNKSSSKRAESAPQTAAPPAVYYHDMNQPEGPSYSAAPAPNHSTHYARNSLVSRERTTISLEPLVAHLGGQGVGPVPLLSSDYLSSDPEPKFELKGLSSALPLSSGSTFCDVYTSDKLDFL